MSERISRFEKKATGVFFGALALGTAALAGAAYESHVPHHALAAGMIGAAALLGEGMSIGFLMDNDQETAPTEAASVAESVTQLPE